MGAHTHGSVEMDDIPLSPPALAGIDARGAPRHTPNNQSDGWTEIHLRVAMLLRVEIMGSEKMRNRMEISVGSQL
eukprot:COSAG01_NODE_724_length_14056_cov_41.795443_16_plen_75_part_00